MNTETEITYESIASARDAAMQRNEETKTAETSLREAITHFREHSNKMTEKAISHLCEAGNFRRSRENWRTACILGWIIATVWCVLYFAK